MAASSPLHLHHSLKKLGFSSNEIDVLAVLFKLKQGTAIELSKKTAVPLVGVQFAISGLVRRGLIRRLNTSKEEVYETCSLKEFKIWIENKKSEHDSIYKEAEEDIEGFFSFMQETSWQPTITYYEGKDEVISLYDDMIQTAAHADDKNIYSWMNMENIEEIFSEYVPEYIEKRKKFGVTSNNILPVNEASLDRGAKKQVEQRNTMFVENFDINGQVRIYGDKVAFITFEEGKPVGFVFQGKKIVDLFKPIFKLYWDDKKHQDKKDRI
ncbi:MAG TPA: helix-turn-helix domain-containing protein [Candidatus Gracilibacteria bacterium]